MGILCSLMHEPRLAGEIRSQVGSDCFYNQDNRCVYEAILKLLDTGKALNFHLLKSHLKDAGQLDKIGGAPRLNTIFTLVPSAADFRDFVENVQEKWARRQSILDCRQRENAALDPNTNPNQWDPDGSYLIGKPRQLSGASFLDFSQRKIDHSQTLLGIRYLCRGGGLFIAIRYGEKRASSTS